MRLTDWPPVFGNPRRYSLYLDEDLVGRLKMLGGIRVAHGCYALRKLIGNTHSRTMSVAALNHYCLMAALHWHGQGVLTA